eukprot:TRINITY_DN107766_c0_g1_i1.p1 TRINITY_DN107766_c0_g1~~TRINITY_DN107766_c0_g1_i1.p1  ORF type:complete len:318 (-),score=70.03 TRINITY_DN107766_c0_g1_i1:55-1008(-)
MVFLLAAILLTTPVPLTADLLVDDECSEEPCSLSTLQLRVRADTAVPVRSPQEFSAALKAVIAAESCSMKYEVSPDLFGTMKSFADPPDPSEKLGSQPLMAWLSGPRMLSALLNDESVGCCAATVRTNSECVCRIASATGIPMASVAPSTHWHYIALHAEVTNSSSWEPQNGLIAVLVPTWTNMLRVLSETMPRVFAGQGCSPSSEVVASLLRWSYKELFEHFKADFLRFGAKYGCAVNTKELLKLGETVCENVVAVRLLLCSLFNANEEFLGTGRGPTGEPEYAVVPSPLLSAALSLANASIFDFWAPKAEVKCST